jgi:hypothetical protein
VRTARTDVIWSFVHDYSCSHLHNEFQIEAFQLFEKLIIPLCWFYFVGEKTEVIAIQEGKPRTMLLGDN